MSNIAPSGDRSSFRVPKTAELVANYIRRRIVVGELREDDALPAETALMEELGISRPTLREAFRILESEGLITVRRGARGGARIQEPSTDVAARYAGLVLQHRATTVADVAAARVIVEAPAARMLAERRDRAVVADQLQQALDTLGVDTEHFHVFNARLVELTENQTLILLTAMLEHIGEAAALKISISEDEADRLKRKARRTRQRLIDLVRAGDSEGAEALWRKHLTEAGATLVAGTGEVLVDLFT